MSLILNIDTTTDKAYISIAENGKILLEMHNNDQKDHASFLQASIKIILEKLNIQIKNIHAVGVTAGPGSYTGIRVGLSSAKGICYALGIPLITLNTLQVLAYEAITQVADAGAWYCPMIDARRMEVFTAVYDLHLKEIVAPCALLLDEHSFASELQKNKIYFFGNGSEKWQCISYTTNAFPLSLSSPSNSMAALTFEYFEKNIFSDLAYAEPFYLKEFFDITKKYI